MQKMIYHANSLSETETIATTFAQSLKGGEVIAFTGEMGAGKTTFVRAVAKVFGAEDQVSSPTFSIVQVYNGDLQIKHFDMYRITDWDSLYLTGFFDDLDDENVVTFIEWSENIYNALPNHTIYIDIQKGIDEIRVLTISRRKENN